MGKTKCGMLLLIAAVTSAPPLQSQFQPARWKSIAHTIERRITTVQTAADGSTTTQHATQVTATDSEGRRYFGSTADANGSGNFDLYDPVAGTKTVWNTETKQAKALTFPTAIPGRKSCWTIPLEEQHHVRGEAQLGIVSIPCGPAEQHQPPSCQAHGNAVEPPYDDSPEVKASYEDCSRMQASVIIAGKISEKDEDLGVETIVGLEAHGCRSTIVAPSGTQIREMWWAEFGTKRRHGGFSLRDVNESSTPGRPTMTTVKTTNEVVSFKFGEPDPGMFHPPDGYTIKRVEMVEAPCDQKSNPKAEKVNSH
jgi:hypothetical protein